MGIEGGLGLRGLIEDFCNHNGGMIRWWVQEKIRTMMSPLGLCSRGEDQKSFKRFRLGSRLKGIVVKKMNYVEYDFFFFNYVPYYIVYYKKYK